MRLSSLQLIARRRAAGAYIVPPNDRGLGCTDCPHVDNGRWTLSPPASPHRRATLRRNAVAGSLSGAGELCRRRSHHRQAGNFPATLPVLRDEVAILRAYLGREIDAILFEKE